MALFDFLLKPIVDLFNRIFGGTVIGKLVNKVSEGIGHITTLLSRIDHLITSIRDEISAFAGWKEDVRFKSRVVNIPAAAEKIGELVTGLRDAWNAIITLVQNFREQATGSDPEQEAAQLAEDLGDAGNIGESLLRRLPKLSQGLEKLLGVVTLFVDAVVEWSDAIDQLQTIIDEITRIREAVETGETIFLSQKNPRRTLQLANGGSIKIRVGKLHS